MAATSADRVNIVPIEFNMPESWTSIEDAIGDIRKYCADGHHPIRLDNRTSVRSYNKKVKSAESHVTELPDDAVYSVKFVCKHFGGPDTNVSLCLSSVSQSSGVILWATHFG